MEYLIGLLLSLAVAGRAALIGFGRDRSFQIGEMKLACPE
jgi:hypothetical protein